MLALPNSRLTSAGERQSAFNAWRYHASTGSRASANPPLPSQKARSVDKAMTRTHHSSPILGLREGFWPPDKGNGFAPLTRGEASLASGGVGSRTEPPNSAPS